MIHVRPRAESTTSLRIPHILAGAFMVALGSAGCGGSDDLGGEETVTSSNGVACEPRMHLFPVAAPHNIGYDPSCTGGPCPISCPDAHANSDWNVDSGGDHHGIDVFAYHGAPLVAVSDATVVDVGETSPTSGLRVKLRDACGWSYYYGHMDEAYVTDDQVVSAGEVIGTMGSSGASSTHLHFNISPGGYYDDIDPFDLLAATSATACGGDPPVDDPPADEPPADGPGDPVPPGGCGVIEPGRGLDVNVAVTSCDGRFALVMQDDGNLVHYQVGGGALWFSGTSGHPASALFMQDDGNLVVYGADWQALWHAGTFGNPGAQLAVQDDGNLVIYGSQGALWSSGTAGY
jgi:hypothetical protein